MGRNDSDLDNVFINFVNENAKTKRMENQEYYDRAWNSSSKDTTSVHEYGHSKKKKKNSEFKRAIVTLLVVTNVLSAGIATIATKVVTNSNNVVINISKDEKQGIKKEIKYYEDLMGLDGDKSNKIIETYGNNPDTGEKYVNFNYANLTRHITEAAKKSETDMRCAILAATNVINAPYREEVFNKVFGYIAKNNPTFEYSDLLKDGFKGYLKELGYDNVNDDMIKMIEDYQKDETNNIIDMEAILKSVDGRGIRK